MGNELAFCCKTHQKAEGSEINRVKLDSEKHHEKFEEQIDKAKSSIIKNDEPVQIIKDKSQDIFENSGHFFAVIPKNADFLKNADFGDEPFEKAQEYQERYTSLYSSYVPKAKAELTKNGETEFLHSQSAFLKDFYVNPEDKENVDLEALIAEKALITRRKHGSIRDDAYLKQHLDSYFKIFKKHSNSNKNKDNEKNNEEEKNEITNNDSNYQSIETHLVSLPAVFIDKTRKDEVYRGSWHLNQDAHFSPNIQNLKSVMKFSGFGINIKEDKSVVEGIFREGEMCGPGRVILANGDLFKGIYTNGFLNDRGIFVDFAGNVYDGEFKLNIMDGHGEEVFVDNSTFKGEYKRNKKNGKGKFVWSDGSFYEGELLDNNLHGKGVYEWASGLKYDGEWSRGVMQGKGIITTANGDYYEGEFKDNKKDGFGLFWWNEKKYYLGYWVDGVQHGFGKFIKEDKLMIGVWHKGKFEKHLEKEQIKFPNFNFHKRVTF